MIFKVFLIFKQTKNISFNVPSLFYIEQEDNPSVAVPGSKIIEVSSAQELTEIVGF